MPVCITCWLFWPKVATSLKPEVALSFYAGRPESHRGREVSFFHEMLNIENLEVVWTIEPEHHT
jgi:hypothetical protein